MFDHTRLRLLRPYFSTALLVLVVVCAYRPAWHGGFVWDDDAYITKNPLLVTSDGLWRIWFSLDSPSQYFPLTYTVFRAERFLWDLDPTGYHWINLLLHVANALLVWRLLAQLEVPGAWLAGLIFALHPVQVESVAWITELKNVLMGFFFLLTLLCWIEYVDAKRKRHRLFYLLALASYVLALTAKSTACTLPFALLLILWWRKPRLDRASFLQTAPFFVLALIMGSIAIWWERYHQGTRGGLFVLGPIERLLVASRAIWFYLSKLFWPSDLTFIYPQWKIDPRDPSAYLWLSATVLVVGAAFAIKKFRKIKIAAVFFVATLSPVVGFIMLYTFRYTFVADHYQYLACIGPIAVASAGIARLRSFTHYGRQLAWVIGATVAFALATLTWQQSSTYRDIETLWRTTIARNPSCWMAYNNLGIVLVARGALADAISQYGKSLQLQPNYAEAHYNLANALLQKGRMDEAIAECKEALKLKPNDPDAHVALGNTLLAKKAVDEAIAEYGLALQLYPDDAVADYDLGNALVENSQLQDAVRKYERALDLQPDMAEAHIQLGNIFLANGDTLTALNHYRAALQLNPTSAAAQNNLAWILATARDPSLRDGQTALNLAEKAARSTGGRNPAVLQVLAAAYAERARFDQAVVTAQSALDMAMQEGKSEMTDELLREITLYKGRSTYKER
jgi:tetratricopeptide (TPR) repeat protein